MKWMQSKLFDEIKSHFPADDLLTLPKRSAFRFIGFFDYARINGSDGVAEIAKMPFVGSEFHYLCLDPKVEVLHEGLIYNNSFTFFAGEDDYAGALEAEWGSFGPNLFSADRIILTSRPFRWFIFGERAYECAALFVSPEFAEVASKAGLDFETPHEFSERKFQETNFNINAKFHLDELERAYIGAI